jgi:hypoxanthine phosphoribosyltransferase
MKKQVTIDDKTFELYLEKSVIESKIADLAASIADDYKDTCPVFVVVLNGGFMFAAEFFKTFQQPCKVEFVKLISYIGAESSGEVINCIGITEEIVKGRDIIVMEDIIDTGLTMDYFLDYVGGMNPKSVRMISMLFKPDSLKKDINLADYCFSIPPNFVVGYGLDYNDKGRNLTDIYQIVND